MAEISKNVQVVTRLRHGEGSDANDVVSIRGNAVVVKTASGSERTFDSDKNYDKTSTNEEIFNDNIAPLITRILNGYNCSVVGYGASHTSKGWTWHGDEGSDDDDKLGIVEMACKALFKRVDAMPDTQTALVTVSMLQLRKSVIVDLLSPKTDSNMNVIDHRAFGCYVEGLATLEVSNAQELKEYIRQGLRVRKALANRGRPRGKPSTFIDIRLETRDSSSSSGDDCDTIRHATLRFCETTGSGGAAAEVDPGLKAFFECAQRLAVGKNSWSIPYDASRYTRLLESSFGGNAFTVFMAFVDTREPQVTDSLATLTMAQHVKKVENKVRMNKNTIQLAIRELRDEIKRARGKLNLAEPSQYLHDINPQLILNLQQMVGELNQVKSQTWEKKRALSAYFLAERKRVLDAEALGLVLSQSEQVPQDMSGNAKALLMNLVSQINALQQTEHAMDLQRLKMTKMKESGADDEKLSKFAGMLKSSETELVKQRDELWKSKADYKKLMMQIVEYEEAQRKVFLLAEEVSKVEKLREEEEWKSAKATMANDPALQKELTAIEGTYKKNIDEVNAKFASVDASFKQEYLDHINTTQEAAVRNKKLEWERDHLIGRLIERDFRHEVQMERYQQHNFFIFKRYRRHFEEQKRRLEGRYREMLQDAVQDALRLQQQNLALQGEVRQYEKTTIA